MAWEKVSTTYKYVNLPDPTGQRDPRPTDAKNGDVVVTGTYVGLSRPMGEYNTQNLLFKEADGSTVSLSAAQLKYAVEDGRIKVGDMVRLTYTGVVTPKQKPGGRRPKPQHTFEIETDKAQRIEMQPQHQSPVQMEDSLEEDELPEALQEVEMQAPVTLHRVPTQTSTLEQSSQSTARTMDTKSLLDKYRQKA